ncbi:DUF4318 domain-containing protein [Peptacetobacter sp.]|uniref:DUF4318 domain-containing protein n=1 Tax=Peptacetobacter sp. TaxID=2991975 RepID=UPI00262C920D|nr:DUF4318 domain-containing protein [Peptacetobacter sp.]
MFNFMKKAFLIDLEDSSIAPNIDDIIKGIDKYCTENNVTYNFISEKEVEIDGEIYRISTEIIRGNYFIKCRIK